MWKAYFKWKRRGLAGFWFSLFVVQVLFLFSEDLEAWTPIQLLKRAAVGSEGGDSVHRDKQTEAFHSQIPQTPNAQQLSDNL